MLEHVLAYTGFACMLIVMALGVLAYYYHERVLWLPKAGQVVPDEWFRCRSLYLKFWWSGWALAGIMVILLVYANSLR